MDKALVFKAVLVQFREQLAQQEKAAGAARAGATGEEVHSESKYDTRATEASYLARGHAMQFEALADSLRTLESYRLPAYTDDTPIGTGALVETATGKRRELYFLLPAGGGITIDCDGREVIVLNARSPLARQLKGRTTGQSVPQPDDEPRIRIRAVW